MVVRLILLMFACLACGVSAQRGNAQPTNSAYSRSISRQGTRVDLQVDHVDPGKERNASFEVGENVRVRFKFTEVATGTPIRGASPAAWLDFADIRRPTTPEECVGKVKRLAEGSTFSAAEVDMNGNYVAVMDTDPSIMVIDPRFAFGDPRLLAVVPLKSPGEDWALSADAGRLYISMPAANAVAVIDTGSWQVIAELPVPGHPARIALQPDGEYLWAAFGSESSPSGVAVFTTRELKLAARIPTGQGYHQMAFSDDGAFAFVTNPGSGTISVISVPKLAKIKDVATGGSPSWIAWSSLAQAAYASSATDGAILAIGGAEHKLLARMMAENGVEQVRFAPGGRFALAINPKSDRVYVVDASSNRIIQTGKLNKEPNQITFTDKMAYIRHRGTDSVLMIPLELLGAENKPVQAGDFTGGEHPPGELSAATPADGIIRVQGDAAVMVANPGDRSVYLYMEGMAAPSGSFNTFGREPRAVLEIERSLRERTPGTYETVVKLTAAGTFDLAMLLDKPQLLSCFDFSVMEDPKRAAQLRPKLKIEPLTTRNGAASATVGKPVSMLFRLHDAETSTPRADIEDLSALVFIPGKWQRRLPLRSVGQGVYSLEFQPPVAGHYDVYLSVPSVGMDFTWYAAVNCTEADK